MIPFPRYLNPQGGVRIGRLLEDMDVFAVHLVFKHVLNPRQVNLYHVIINHVGLQKFSSHREKGKLLLSPLSLPWLTRSTLQHRSGIYCPCPKLIDHVRFSVLTVTSVCLATSPGLEPARQSPACSWSSWWMGSGRGR